MANQTTVQLKRSSVAGKLPDAANVEVGEPVVNLADKKVYTKNGSDEIIQIASGNLQGLADVSNANPLSNQVLAWNGVIWAPSNVSTSGGAVDSVNGQTGVVTLTTTNVAEGSNLYYTDTRARNAISVTGSGSYDNTTGVITVTGGSGSYSDANTYANVQLIGFATNDNVALKADLTGATFTGNVITTNLLPQSDDSGSVGDAGRTWNNGHFTNLSVDTLGSISGTLNVRTALDLGTDDPLRLGDNDDIEIYHDGTNSYIDLNSGNLVFRDTVSNRATFVRTTGDLVLSTGNAQANYFVGDGSALTNVKVSNSNITGNIISSQLEPTGVTASTYGSSTIIPVLTVDQQGRITSAANVAFSGGDVVGPASSTDNALVRFDGTGGKTIQGTPVTAVLDDSANLGLGIAASGAKLHLYEAASGPTLKFERGSTALVASDAIGIIDFVSNDNTPANAGGTRVRLEGEVSGTTGAGQVNVLIATGSSTTLTSRFIIDSAGIQAGAIGPLAPNQNMDTLRLRSILGQFYEFWGSISQTPADTSTDVSLAPFYVTGYNYINTLRVTVGALAEGTAGTAATTAKFSKTMEASIAGDDSGNFVVTGAATVISAGTPAPFVGPSPGVFLIGTTVAAGKATIVAAPPGGVVLRLTNYATSVPTRAPITATYFTFRGTTTNF